MVIHHSSLLDVHTLVYIYFSKHPIVKTPGFIFLIP